MLRSKKDEFLELASSNNALEVIDLLPGVGKKGSAFRSRAVPPAPAWQMTLKRLFDIAIASLFLVAVAPFMLLIAILIKLDSEGPVFYSQTRVGVNNRRMPSRRRGELLRREMIGASDRRVETPVNRRVQNSFGRMFKVLKFRTMRTDAEANGKPKWCEVNDPRVTRIGALLRKTHLDELPQLFNILMGDMSLVGPRPERPEFVRWLRNVTPAYEERLMVKPGLTGLAQIHHRADLELSDVKKKVRYDLLYLKRVSVWTDIKIILGTVPLVFGVSQNDLKKLDKKTLF